MQNKRSEIVAQTAGDSLSLPINKLRGFSLASGDVGRQPGRGLVGWGAGFNAPLRKTEGVGFGGDGEATVAVKSRTPRCDFETLFCLIAILT